MLRQAPLMREIGVSWLLWIVVLGGGGFALGALVVFTMAARFRVRLFAAGLVLAALLFAVGLNVVGLAPPWFGLYGVFLIPVATAIGLRRLWSGAKGERWSERD